MKVEAVIRPLSIGCVRDGGVYRLPPTQLTLTNLFLRVASLDELFVKVPSERGFEDYRKFVKRVESSAEDIRPIRGCREVRTARIRAGGVF